MVRSYLAILLLIAVVAGLEAHRVFTKEELAKYDGSDASLPIYIAIKGRVFDVSKGRDFYGKGGSYNVFAGKDCTRAVALWSKDPKDMTPDLSGLSSPQLHQLENVYDSLYKAKYTIIGVMDYYEGGDDEDGEL